MDQDTANRVAVGKSQVPVMMQYMTRGMTISSSLIPEPRQVMTTRMTLSNSRVLEMKQAMTTRMISNQTPGPRQVLVAREISAIEEDT